MSSAWPFSLSHSTVWNPGAVFLPVYCSITRFPEKPICPALYSNNRCPRLPIPMATPPKVGSVIKVTTASPACSTLLIASCALGILTIDEHPSCILAPPPQACIIIGTFLLIAIWAARQTFSPVLMQKEPPRNPKSVVHKTIFFPQMVPSPVIIAVSKPVFMRVSFNFSI